MSDTYHDALLREQITAWQACALKAEADRVSAQTNADELLADLREAEEALRVVLNEKSDEACRLIDMANNANLRANKAEEALRAAFEAINDDDISGAHLILRTYLAGASP